MRCPYHNKPHPCSVCQKTPLPYIVPHRRLHTHGSQRPCKIRCGANEGLYVLNTETRVDEIFTDELIGCAQVILRNNTTTFTCHIITDAPNPITFMLAACSMFQDEYGSVTACHVISGENTSLGNQLYDWLGPKLHLLVNRVVGSHGYTIKIRGGAIRRTPTQWNPSCDDVAGWLTAQDLIHLRITDRVSIGDPSPGDYFETCAACNTRLS